MKEKHLRMYMEMAQVAAKSSYAVKLKVGAIAVKDHRILSVGYNGTPTGMDNVCEHYSEYGEMTTKKEVIHAEMNLILKMARDGQSGSGSDLFITHSPCFECAKAILSVGFRKVWFNQNYRDPSGATLLKENGIEVEQI
jgi:dCMP deaminase